MRFKPTISEAACGATIAALAVTLEASGVVRAPVNGFCVSCHASDLVSWLISRVSHVSWAFPRSAGAFPLLTTAGLFLGGLLAAKLAGEYRARGRGSAWRGVAAGALASNLALVALGCPTRQILRLGYGDWSALVAALGFLGGAALGTLIIKWSAQRI